MHGIMPRKRSTSSNLKSIIPELEVVIMGKINHQLCPYSTKNAAEIACSIFGFCKIRWIN